MANELSQADPIRLNSAANTNLTLIKAGKCSIGTMTISNTGGAVAFVKLYDKATAPVLATDVPVLTVPVAANGLQVITGPVFGLPFELGLALAITNLATDADATAVATSQVKIIGSVAGQ